MKYSNLGIGLLLFAILLEMCSSGLSALSLCLGGVYYIHLTKGASKKYITIFNYIITRYQSLLLQS